MQDAAALLILEAAYDLSETTQAAVRRIAKAATLAVFRGPVAVGRFDTNSQLDTRTVHYERADKIYELSLTKWERSLPAAIRRLALLLPPRTINFHFKACTYLPVELQAAAREILPLCAMANTGDGGGLHIVFGSPDMRDWPPARARRFDVITKHLATAWRIRMSLSAGGASQAIAAELRVDGVARHLLPEASTPTAREALRCAVLTRERIRSGLRSAAGHELWPALVAGRWSLLDAFTAAGTRYVVAYENPSGTAKLRALRPRERIVLGLILEGRSGKWIALELQLSESTVTRTLHTALRRIGVTDITALAGTRTALFESLENLTTGGELVIATLMRGARALATLSDAERAIVADILGGKRVATIARDRRTSFRTVGHQISSLYKKLEVSSRGELLALLA